jgi:hypothetical protein
MVNAVRWPMLAEKAGAVGVVVGLLPAALIR